MEYSSNAKGNLGVTLGAVGTGLGLLDGGASLLGRMLGNGGMGGSPEDRPVTRYEMGLIQDTINQKIDNSYLRGQLDTSAKFEGVQRQFADQLAFNATVSANVGAVAQQTAEWNAEKAQQIVQSVIDSGEKFNVIYAENDDMAKGAVAALDAAGISHGVGKDVIIMGFDCNKWALEELLKQNWNYDGQCNPFQASYIDDIIKTIEGGSEPAEKTVIMDEKGFDATTITQEDVDKYGI